MHSLTHDYPAVFLAESESPRLSLYQPSHRQHPDNAQDPLRFPNLVKRLAASLRENCPVRDMAALLAPFKALAVDRGFWNHAADGLAVLGAPDFFWVYRLQRPVAELAVVADSFHAKPLMRIVQSADRYQVLGLNRHSFKVFEGKRDALDELPPFDGMSQSADQLLGKARDDREGAHRAHGPHGSADVARHGTDVKQDAEDRDTEHFFRAVDAAVLKRCSQPSGQSLILAALPQPHYLQRLAGLVESFGAAASNGRGTNDLRGVAAAAAAGRVQTLLIEAERLLPSRIDATSGEITTADLAPPEVDDVLDDLGEIVLRKGGEVIVVPP